jgi:hypothetical protein
MKTTDWMRTLELTGRRQSSRSWGSISAWKLQLICAQIGRRGFALSGIWALVAALLMNRGYQDSWVLEGLWLPLLLALFFYGVTLLGNAQPAETALLTSGLVFLGYNTPLIKYNYIYASTIDASVHFSLMRSLATTGTPTPNVYAFTPGFHILVASLSQLSGLPAQIWAAILPGLMGSLIPLGIYLLCKRTAMPQSLLRSTVVVSGLSLPLLYLPNGTTYAVLIISPLLLLLMAWNSDLERRSNRIGFGLLSGLLLLTLIIWHAISSLLMPIAMVVSGLMALLLSSQLGKWSYRQSWIRRVGVSLTVVGAIAAVATLAYWRFVATPIWDHLMRNIDLFSTVIRAGVESEGVLIPERTFTLQLKDLLTVFLLYHGRDVVFLFLSAVGIAFNAGSFIAALRSNSEEPRYVQLVRLFALLSAIFCLVLVMALVTGFAKHGYKRYLLYIIAMSSPIAGYGLWRMVQFLHDHLRVLPRKMILAVSVILIYIIAGLQLFPYQPMVPTAPIPGTDGTTPLYWHHEVNTEYQRRGIGFAYFRMPEEANLFTDYRSFQQAALFFGPEAKQQFSYTPWQSPRPAYVLLHVPGKAGAYGEQAEYRSVEAIEARRQLQGVSTVYDNGGTFLLQVPAGQMEQIYLEDRENLIGQSDLEGGEISD